MLNKRWIVLAIIFILLIGLYLSLLLNPPLENSEVSYNSYASFTIATEMNNLGFADIKVKEVNLGAEEVVKGSDFRKLVE